MANFPQLLRNLPPFVGPFLIVDGKETRYRAGDWYQVPAKGLHAARFDLR